MCSHCQYQVFFKEWYISHWCVLRRGFFVPNCHIFTVSSMFIYKCNPGEANDKRICFIIPTSSNENEGDELLCTARSLVMVRESFTSARRWSLLVVSSTEKDIRNSRNISVACILMSTVNLLKSYVFFRCVRNFLTNGGDRIVRGDRNS